MLAGLESSSLLRAAVLLAAGGLFAFVLGRGLVPSGVLRMRRGLPATLALRGLLTAAFAGSDAFLPLAVTGIRGRSVLVASLVVSSVTITWTAGSWVADRFLSTWGVTRLVTAGFVILAVGIGWETALLTPSIPLGVAMIGTGFAGLGIGLAFSPLSTAALGAATAGGEGRASGALALIENLGFALGPGITGALVGLSERGHLSLAGALGWGWGIAALVGVLAAVLAHRMITSPA